MIEKRGYKLNLITVIAFLYCLRFGYILTAYGHGGQMVGIPFAILMLLLTIGFHIIKDENIKLKLYQITISAFLILAGFSLTMETIRATNKDYFQFLYSEPEGVVNYIFLIWIVIGGMIFFRKIVSNKKMKADNKS